MGQNDLSYTEEAGYLCSTCHTLLALCSDLKNIGIQCRLGDCFHFTKCYNILEHDSGRVHVFKYGPIQQIETAYTNDPDSRECKKLFCKVCNNFVGWKTKTNKYVVIKKRII